MERHEEIESDSGSQIKQKGMYEGREKRSSWRENPEVQNLKGRDPVLHMLYTRS